MAKLNIKLKKPTASTFRGWSFVLIAGLVLAIIAVIDRGGLQAVVPSSTGSTGCTVQVTVPELNVRTGPSQTSSQVQTLTQGTTVDGTRTVTDGFRQLKDGNWVFDQYVTPTPGSTCS
jgi:uncharacterized protein YgiM (DUF1202 family)